MHPIRVLAVCFVALVGWMLIGPQALADHDDPTPIQFVDDRIVFELLGQVINFATPAPLGSSIQYGYLTRVRGIANVFGGSPQNETTALLTFFNEATTTQTNISGPLLIPTRRNGTTTIFLNSAPASFADPDSFRSGIPVLTSTLHQQAVVDTATGAFTAVFDNTITWAARFTIDGREFKLGRKGQAFRTTLTGHLNPTPPPLGYFGGYSVGAARR
jgi:hypothetical protein